MAKKAELEKLYQLYILLHDLLHLARSPPGVGVSCGDVRNLGLNGLLHDVVELDLIGSDDVDGHIHLVNSD